MWRKKLTNNSVPSLFFVLYFIPNFTYIIRFLDFSIFSSCFILLRFPPFLIFLPLTFYPSFTSSSLLLFPRSFSSLVRNVFFKISITFPICGSHFLRKDHWHHLLSLRKGFLLYDTPIPVYDMIKISNWV